MVRRTRKQRSPREQAEFLVRTKGAHAFKFARDRESAVTGEERAHFWSAVVHELDRWLMNGRRFSFL
jgi:hypothetical protein